MERSRNDDVRGIRPEEEDGYESVCASCRRDRIAFGLRDNAGDANLPRRIPGSGWDALSAASSSSTASTDDLSGWNDGSGGHGLPNSATAAAAALAASVPKSRGRTRLSLRR